MKQFITILFVITSFYLKADSPLTSTPFSSAYESEKMIQYVKDNGLDKKGLKFLAKKNGNAVLKIVVINELGWGKEQLVGQYENYLLKKRKGLEPSVFSYLRTVSEEIPVENEQTNFLTADDLMCWAYLQAMGDYFNPNLASRAAYLAYVREPKSMAHAAVFTLIACQIAFDTNWCYVYKNGKEFLIDMKYEENRLKPEAVKIIMDYLRLYKSDCES